ncbi:MAG TPA: hypothetical protein VNT30_16085 [Stellaceae bacterium]|nr:hypothetical protein [Stellaceae bacterium]
MPANGASGYSASTLPPITSGSGADTGTLVGHKVAALRGELAGLQQSVAQHDQELQSDIQNLQQNSAAYYASVGSINTRLQIGTTPGNPQLIAQWNQAQGNLDKIASSVGQLTDLSNKVAADSSLAAYLLENTRASYGLQGAVDEDHRQLGLLENDVNRTVVSIDRLLNQLNDDISRQNASIGVERGNLTTLSLAIKNGELLGGNLSNRAFAPVGPSSMISAQPLAKVAAQGAVAPPSIDRRPLVVIRFDRPNVVYEPALYTAVNRALERKPNAQFDLVAVSPGSGSPAQAALDSTTAKRNADTVMRSLSSLGLPLDRVNLSSMTSASAQTSEVHLYVR